MRGGYSRRRAALRATSALPPAPPQELQPSYARRDEERAEQEPDHAAAVGGRHDEEGDPDPDERDREDGDASAVEPHAAACGAAATMTRHGACLSTKSTVSPKIARRRRRYSRATAGPITIGARRVRVSGSCTNRRRKSR